MIVSADIVREALGKVFDPCSVASKTALSIVEMGMVTRVCVSDVGDVDILLRPTSLMCTLITGIMQAVDEQISALPGVASLTLDIDRESPWSEASMTEEGRQRLHETRTRSRAAMPVAPQQWKLRVSAQRAGRDAK